MPLKSLLAPFAAVTALIALPVTTFADHKVKVYRDLDGDGHYNKKTYETSSHGHYSHNYHQPYYGYRPNYYRGYRPSYYGYPRSYYSYPRTTLGVSIFSRPTYSTSRVYRGVEYRDSLAADVQSALRRRGYYRGPIDGDIGYGSRSAIRAYQRDHGLSVTGRIDSTLLRSLHIG